ncbi:hypothetical protein [Streptomyces lavendulae]|uniref:hypothetical protein n=1 Tax=Streptomyces lavendulae TaxID=1914 RepID=UPI0031EA28D1
MMTLSDGKSIILFRSHDNPHIARNRIEILRHFNPEIPIHVAFGGDDAGANGSLVEFAGLVESFWVYPELRSDRWKWTHGDLIVKAWHREVGKDLDFDFAFLHEYDLLFSAPLLEVYPNINNRELSLTACTPFSPGIEKVWAWTSSEVLRPEFLKFSEHMRKRFGLERQKYVCLGPGSLLSREFMDAWCDQEEVEVGHDELKYPACAEILGFDLVDNGLHVGGLWEYYRLFNCRDHYVTKSMVVDSLKCGGSRTSFHPVKEDIGVADLLRWV